MNWYNRFVLVGASALQFALFSCSGSGLEKVRVPVPKEAIGDTTSASTYPRGMRDGDLDFYMGKRIICASGDPIDALYKDRDVGHYLSGIKPEGASFDIVPLDSLMVKYKINPPASGNPELRLKDSYLQQSVRGMTALRNTGLAFAGERRGEDREKFLSRTDMLGDVELVAYILNDGVPYLAFVRVRGR